MVQSPQARGRRRGRRESVRIMRTINCLASSCQVCFSVTVCLSAAWADSLSSLHTIDKNPRLERYPTSDTVTVTGAVNFTKYVRPALLWRVVVVVLIRTNRRVEVEGRTGVLYSQPAGLAGGLI